MYCKSWSPWCRWAFYFQWPLKVLQQRPPCHKKKCFSQRPQYENKLFNRQLHPETGYKSFWIFNASKKMIKDRKFPRKLFIPSVCCLLARSDWLMRPHELQRYDGKWQYCFMLCGRQNAEATRKPKTFLFFFFFGICARWVTPLKLMDAMLDAGGRGPCASRTPPRCRVCAMNQ